jgi:hypothetical protein
VASDPLESLTSEWPVHALEYFPCTYRPYATLSAGLSDEDGVQKVTANHSLVTCPWCLQKLDTQALLALLRSIRS